MHDNEMHAKGDEEDRKSIKVENISTLCMHHLCDSEKNYSFHSYKLFTN
jgi:hypothetical protein